MVCIFAFKFLSPVGFQIEGSPTPPLRASLAGGIYVMCGNTCIFCYVLYIICGLTTPTFNDLEVGCSFYSSKHLQPLVHMRLFTKEENKGMEVQIFLWPSAIFFQLRANVFEGFGKNLDAFGKIFLPGQNSRASSPR